MEYQRSNLNTLPRTLILKLLIHKRTMRRPSRPPVSLGIKTLDQQDLLGSLLPQKEPLMTLTRLDREGLTDSIRIDQLHGQQILIRNRSRVRNGQRIFTDGFDGAPCVNDLIAAAEKALGFLWEVVGDAFGAGFVGLVDVNLLDGAT